MPKVLSFSRIAQPLSETSRSGENVLFPFHAIRFGDLSARLRKEFRNFLNDNRLTSPSPDIC